MTCPFVFPAEHLDFRSTCENSVFRKGSRSERNFPDTPVDFTLVADRTFFLFFISFILLLLILLLLVLSSFGRAYIYTCYKGIVLASIDRN